MIEIQITDEVRAAVRAEMPSMIDEVVRAVRTVLDDRLLTVAEAAEMLGSSTASAYKRIARGELPVVRVGRSVRIRLSSLAGA